MAGIIIYDDPIQKTFTLFIFIYRICCYNCFAIDRRGIKMKQSFELVMEGYQLTGRKVDLSLSEHATVMKTLPSEIRRFLNRPDLIIKGSVGQGNRNDNPWISILNNNITHTTQEGLYVVYLFKKDMTGFYLALSQGITNFKNRYGSRAYSYAAQVAKYFQKELQDINHFSVDPIDLNSPINSLGYGYEKTTILSKYYPRNNYSEAELVQDLRDMIFIYDFMYQHMNHTTYTEVIQSILQNPEDSLVDGDEAVSVINHVLEDNANYPRDNNRTLVEVRAYEERSQRFRRVVSTRNTKTDYLRKAAQDLAIGLEGEKLAIEFEKNRLRALGLDDYAERVQWSANQSDVLGYDIKSFDLDGNGNVVDFHIEVKTTVTKVDTNFFVSKNEVNKSNELGNYAVFRIYDALSIHPKYYLARGPIETNFILDPATYSATYRWRVQPVA